MRAERPGRALVRRLDLHAARAPRPRPSPRRSRPPRCRRRASARPAALAGRKVDARDLEQRDVLVAGVDVVAGRLDEPVQERPCAGPPARPRAAPAARARRSGSRLGTRLTCRPRTAGADEHVLDDAAQALLTRQPAEHRRALRQRARDLVAAGSARPPRRGRPRASRRGRARSARSTVRSSATSKPSRSRISRCSSAGDLEPDELRRPAPAEGGRPAGSGSSPCTSVVPGPARAGQLDDQLRRVDAPPARRGTGRRPSPSGSSPRCAAEALRAAQDPDRLEVRGLEQDVGRRRRRPRVSSPPMIPAIATGALGVGDHRSSGSSLRSVAVERAQLLARPRPADDDPPAARACRSRRRAAGCRARA